MEWHFVSSITCDSYWKLRIKLLHWCGWYPSVLYHTSVHALYPKDWLHCNFSEITMDNEPVLRGWWIYNIQRQNGSISWYITLRYQDRCGLWRFSCSFIPCRPEQSSCKKQLPITWCSSIGASITNSRRSNQLRSTNYFSFNFKHPTYSTTNRLQCRKQCFYSCQTNSSDPY